MKFEDMKLGHTYTDRTIGISGWAVSFLDKMSGANQVEIRPFPTEEAVKAGKLMDCFYIDPQTLEPYFSATHGAIGSQEAQVLVDIKLGDTVQDTVTGQTGVVSERCTMLNGCIGYYVPLKNLQTGLFEAGYFDQARLVIIKEGESKTATVKVNGNTPGPATVRAVRREV